MKTPVPIWKPRAEGRCYRELRADEGAPYDEHVEIDLSSLEPLIACPSSPGNVVPVREVAGIKADQVIIGSSVNSSFRDLMVVAKILEGRHRHPDTSLHINPGSNQVLENVAHEGGLALLLRAGARIHQSGCLGCIGMGQAPGTGQVSLRTFPRNFPGRSGTRMTASISALRRQEPRRLLRGDHRSQGPGQRDELSENHRSQEISRGQGVHHFALRGTSQNRSRERPQHQAVAEDGSAS